MDAVLLKQKSADDSISDRADSVSFIIPALNEVAMLGRLLVSIERLKHVDSLQVVEIILVDAKSTDGTVELAKRYGCKVVSAKPGNVSRSRNLGARCAKGTVLAFVDADCELPSEWLLAVAAELQDNTVVAVGSAMAESALDATWVERAWFELAHRDSPVAAASDIVWLASFNLVVRSGAFEKAGGFDEQLITCEDVEFSYRIGKLGRLRKLNQCRVIHHGESKSLKEFYRREAWRSRGSFGILRTHWKKPRELVGFFLPFFVSVSILAGFLVGIAGLVVQGQAGKLWVTLFAPVLGFLPVLVLVLRKRVRIEMIAQCWFLLSVYYFARLIGIVRPFPRLERAAG